MLYGVRMRAELSSRTAGKARYRFAGLGVKSYVICGAEYVPPNFHAYRIRGRFFPVTLETPPKDEPAVLGINPSLPRYMLHHFDTERWTQHSPKPSTLVEFCSFPVMTSGSG